MTTHNFTRARATSVLRFMNGVLQQRYNVTTWTQDPDSGRTGGYEFKEEWRDVPHVEELPSK